MHDRMLVSKYLSVVVDAGDEAVEVEQVEGGAESVA